MRFAADARHALLGIVATLLACSPQSPADPEDRFELELVDRAPPSSPEAIARRDREAAWLAVRALPSEALDDALAGLEATIASHEAREIPLLIDFATEDQGPEAGAAMRFLLPAWTAARALVERRWRLPGSDGTVVLRWRSEPATDRRTIAVWPLANERSDDMTRRARLAAWPLARGLLVQCSSARSMQSTDEALRAGTGEPHGPAALVVTRQTLRLPAPNPSRLRALGADVARARSLPEDVTRFARALALGPPQDPGLRWLALSDREALLIPRLGSIAAPHRLIGYARSALSTAGTHRDCTFHGQPERSSR